MKDLFVGFDANHKRIYLTPEDRANHMHIIGSPGSGKSKSLEWMIREDIKKSNGLCLIDPHGSLYEEVVKWCAYHCLSDREIILLNPSSGDYILGFNPFRRARGDTSVQVDYMITATIRAWDMENTDETPTLERWLRCIYQALIDKDQTIEAAGYLIDYFEGDVRKYLTTDLSKEIIQREWEKLSSSKSLKLFEDQILSTKNKLFRFLCSDQIKRFMGLKEPNVDLANIIEEGKVLLVNLAESDYLSRENARLFGALLVNEFFQLAKRRKKDEWGNSPRPFHLYIDEFQNFVTPDIGPILAQGRKFGLFLILAHQTFGQIEEKIKSLVNIVMGTVKIKAVFGGLTRGDAKRVVEETFVNQLNFKEIKKAIYQIKFWPMYTRDKVYSTGHTSGDLKSTALSLGGSIHQIEGEGWFGPPGATSTTTTEVELSASGKTEADAYGEIDIPVFFPVPYEELTSMEYWKLDEQIWRMSDALMAQFPRHCFIKILNQKTQPMLVPLVKEFYVDHDYLVQFQNDIYNQTKAIPAKEADLILNKQKEELELLAKEEIKYPTQFRE